MESSSPIVLFTPCVRLQVIHIHSHLQHPRWPSVFFPLGGLVSRGVSSSCYMLPSVLFLSWEHILSCLWSKVLTWARGHRIEEGGLVLSTLLLAFSYCRLAGSMTGQLHLLYIKCGGSPRLDDLCCVEGISI